MVGLNDLILWWDLRSHWMVEQSFEHSFLQPVINKLKWNYSVRVLHNVCARPLPYLPSITPSKLRLVHSACQ
ncbi:hypothetical protein L484_008032 [Morus notabilis]|uniref:Uncharacterized protein n=1 Tax=Morus notabilis TaxID=981085 RepID=W9QJ95_9ROSA|nr:hypothetical protein L484_008032 [Morus notabilis]